MQCKNHALLFLGLLFHSRSLPDRQSSDGHGSWRRCMSRVHVCEGDEHVSNARDPSTCHSYRAYPSCVGLTAQVLQCNLLVRQLTLHEPESKRHLTVLAGMMLPKRKDLRLHFTTIEDVEPYKNLCSRYYCGRTRCPATGYAASRHTRQARHWAF